MCARDECEGDELTQKRMKGEESKNKQTIERCDKWLSFAQNHVEHLNMVYTVQLGTFHSFCFTFARARVCTHTIPIQKMLKAMKTYVKKAIIVWTFLYAEVNKHRIHL